MPDEAQEKLPVNGNVKILAASIFGLAFLLRLIYIFEISASPFFENLVIDCARYSDRANEIAAGDWLGTGIFYQSPLYAYFLGVFYRFVTSNLFAVRLLQAAIGSGSCVLLFLVANRLFDRRAAAFCGFAAAAFAPFIYYDAMIMKTVFSIFLAALGLYLLLRAMDSDKPALWLTCGMSWGAASLVRENYLLIAAAFGAWLLARHLKDRRAAKLRPFWFFLGGVAIMILPVTARNIAVGGEFALVTSQAGQNFYIGNNPANRTGAYEVPDFVIANPRWEEKSFREYAEKKERRKMSASEVSAFYRGEALSWMSENPGPAFVLTAKKFLLFFNNYEVADNQSIYFMERYSGLLRLDFVRFGLLAPLGILGLILLWRKGGKFAPLYLFSFIYAATVIAFFIFGRYRLPVMVVLLPCAGYAFFHLLDNFRRKEFKALLKPGLVLAGLYVFTFLPVYRYHDEMMAMRLINLGQVRVRIAERFAESGDGESAAAELTGALEAYAGARDLMPGAAEPHIYAARALVRAGMRGKAEKQYRLAVSKAPKLASARLELAKLLFDSGAFFEADEFLDVSLEAAPGDEELKIFGERVSAALRDAGQFEKLLEENPGDIWAQTYLGVARLLNRENDGAFAAIDSAIVKNPDYIPANNAMALFFIYTLKHEEAEFYAKRVTKLGGTLWNAVREELESCPKHRHDPDGRR